jgi:hypothetical protein
MDHTAENTAKRRRSAIRALNGFPPELPRPPQKLAKRKTVSLAWLCRN